ncbi:MAG: organic hydroperoxide resistance protein [Alphaproteobacteria bacterium]|nr:organic hydroperoxide resistance protein [Alphaproteobacteria bacterium]
MKVLYTATATASGGREGRVHSSDGVLDLELSMPKELGGSGRAATNPEQLFAAGYAACFENALQRAGREAKTPIEGTEVTAEVGIGRKEDTRFALTVALTVKIPNLERAQAEKLMNRAHEEICPYSNATRGNIEVSVTLA